MTAAKSSRATAIDINIRPECVGTTVLNDDRLGLLLPISWTGEYKIDGNTVETDQAFLVDSPNGFFNRGRGRRFYALTIERAVFVDTLAALLGVKPDDFRLGSMKLQLPAGESARLELELSEILKHAKRMQPDQFSQSILRIVLDTYLAGRSELTKTAKKPKRALTIVKRSEDRFNELIDTSQAPSLADLCAAANVSKTVLYEAFDHIAGIPPLQYFRLRRLHRAHEELDKQVYRPGGVAKIASELGFKELGRFALEYKRLFGESPSVTLKAVQR